MCRDAHNPTPDVKPGAPMAAYHLINLIDTAPDHTLDPWRLYGQLVAEGLNLNHPADTACRNAAFDLRDTWFRRLDNWKKIQPGRSETQSSPAHARSCLLALTAIFSLFAPSDWHDLARLLKE